MKILITGSDGQMGQAYQLYPDTSEHEFFFSTKQELDITDYKKLESFFNITAIDYVINFAAFSKEKSKIDKNEAYNVNVIGVKNLAIICKKYGVAIIHISTSYVFDGKKELYYEDDLPSPDTEFGKTKLLGEYEIIKHCSKYIILRCSTIYGNFSNNFFTDLLDLSQRRSEINIFENEITSPTSTYEVCRAIDSILTMGISENISGIYHFSSLGKVSSADFAKEILKRSLLPVIITGVKNDYRNLCINSSKFINTFHYQPLHWKISLAEVLDKRKKYPIKVGFSTTINGIEHVIASIDWSKQEATLLNVENFKDIHTVDFKEIIVQNI